MGGVTFREALGRWWAAWLVLGVLTAMSIYPFVFVLITAFKTKIAYNKDPIGLPAEPTLGAWQAGPSNTLYRSIPSFTGDPSYEVLLLPPSSGHPTQAERFLLQFPADLLERPMQERAMVVGLHGFQQSEKSIFLNTELPWECASRGWILLAPYGMTDTHFGNVGSQQRTPDSSWESRLSWSGEG